MKFKQIQEWGWEYLLFILLVSWIQSLLSFFYSFQAENYFLPFLKRMNKMAALDDKENTRTEIIPVPTVLGTLGLFHLYLLKNLDPSFLSHVF